ncbi:MBL fold metallo-hydrolase [Paenibacillus hemerocallicola]|uniref:MBL fold metallo-hydrolase n=1 Tax=Paenibacillus hemerocallicola TaxID=1172614 RepID=A0A5C4TEB3_9BACL|nr:MBL fold metallo-hydrolase [Paenibacillus hemerocallicola]TNJ66976.1 MBL fold metallo-hydrolase [Paenibacillus hemerocallicola]
MTLWTEYPDGIIQVRLPLGQPLPWINSYLIQGKEGLTVIDPGPRSEAAIAIWHQVCERFGYQYTDIGQIVLTHHHPDHYGLAGWLQQHSGAPVRMTRAGNEQADGLWGPGRPLAARIAALFGEHGLPQSRLHEVLDHFAAGTAGVEPRPTVTELSLGERLRIGDRSFEAIDTPGHAAGHVSLYGEESGVLLCGDLVLPESLPNVSYVPGYDVDPIASFTASLEQVESLPVRLALPGHQNPFSAFSERLVALRKLHSERQEKIEQSLGTEAVDAYELSQRVFGQAVSVLQLRFYLGETIARLHHAVQRGKVKSIRSEGGTGYVRIYPN